MAKTNITLYSSTPSSNTDINNINIDENCPASGLNNAIRELMAHLKNVDTGSQALTSPSFTAMSTDTISEKTSANGVSIDSVTLKDGELGTTANPVPIHSTSLNGGQFGGRRNMVINGAMQVAQRGTSFTSAGYTLDRFNLSLSGATGTVTQESFALDSEIAGLKNFLKLDVTTGNNFCGIQHRIEDVDTIKGGEIYTISFYAKGTNSGGGNLALRGRQSFGSGGSTEVITFTESITLTSSWQRFSFTKTQSSLSGKTIGTGSYFELFFHQPELDTSTNAWELNITGIQLEVGEQATPFEHRSFGEELALCQRYYFEQGNYPPSPNSGYEGFFVAAAWNVEAARGVYHLPTTMRTTPTLSTSGNFQMLGGSNGGASSFSLADSGGNPAVAINIVTSGATVGDAFEVRSDNDQDARIQFDAEL